MAGPVPVSLHFKVQGSLGFSVGVGLNGGSRKKLCQESGGCSTTGVKCGDSYNVETSGGLIYLKPEAEMSLDGTGAVDLIVISGGVGLNIQLLSLSLPASLEFNIGGANDAHCLSTKLVVAALSGRVYVYAEAWLVGRREWNLFDWNGPSWTYPPGDTPSQVSLGM